MLRVLLTATVLATVHALPTVLEVPILIPASATASEGMGEDLDAIVVDAGETTTFQPQPNDAESLGPFDPSDCFLPKARGPCRALLEAFYFNTATKACEGFSWSGCGGNANRFRAKEDCERNCMQPAIFVEDGPRDAVPIGQPSLNQSLTPPTVKPKHKLPSCPKFSGCGQRCVIVQDRSDRGCRKCLCGDLGEGAGPKVVDLLPGPVVISSGNVTVSKSSNGDVSIGSVSGLPKDAEEDGVILGDPSENCKLPTKRGHCRGMMTRYHYDPAVKDCVQFHYGGCDGNLNNFVSKEKCLEYCKGQ